MRRMRMQLNRLKMDCEKRGVTIYDLFLCVLIFVLILANLSAFWDIRGMVLFDDDWWFSSSSSSSSSPSSSSSLHHDSLQQLCDRLLAMFEKYPALVVNTKLTLLQSIKRSAATTSFSQLPQHRQQQILAIQIIWLIGEYLQTEHTHTEFKVVVEYQQVLAQVIDTQMAIHVAICKANDTDGAIRSPRHSGRGKDSGSSNSSRIAPPRVLMGLLDNRSNSVYGGHDGSSPSYHYQQQHQPHYHSRKDTLSVQRESDGHNIGGDRKADGISYIQSLSGGEEIATRLIHVSLMAVCKLAARCVELVPSVRAILIRVLGNRSMLPASVSLRASQCARLLQQPSIAYSLFKEPFFCSPHLNENTPLTLMTNHPDASDFIIPQKNRSFIPSNESNITVAKDPSPAAPLR
mmetsp:Transcript_7062/g.11156  ORF Transcript_7062/g.11156 Transcript_7062/m.11156 type:complete len:404 (-) Transcript_7062:86-1297(-)